MNNEQQELLDEAYKNYLNNFIKPICPPNLDIQPDYYKPMTKEWFIKSTKENNSRGQEFSKRWGLKIEERELSRKERSDYYYKHGNSEGIVEGSLDRPIWENDETAHRWYDDKNIPTKAITITYNGKTIESYE